MNEVPVSCGIGLGVQAPAPRPLIGDQCHESSEARHPSSAARRAIAAFLAASVALGAVGAVAVLAKDDDGSAAWPTSAPVSGPASESLPLTAGPQEPAVELRTRRYTPRTAEETQRWQEQLRGDLSRLLKLDERLAERTKTPLDPQLVRSEERAGYELRELELQSTAARRIRVLLTLPAEKAGPHPAVVCIHGHGGKLSSVHEPGLYKAFAAELAARGYVTIATTVSQHEIREEGWTLMGERLWDLMRCVDYLETLDEVDAKRIGCGGLSLGGEMAMWLGAIDPRIAATVSSGFLTRMDQMEKGHCMCWKFPGLRELVDYADIYALIAPRALQCQNGWKEPATDFTVELASQAMAEIELIYTDLGQLQKLQLVAHGGAHEIDLPSLRDFFDRELGGVSR